MNDELKTELKDLGLNDEQITAIGENLGVTLREDMQFVTLDMLTGQGLKPVVAAKVLKHFAQPEAVAGSTTGGDEFPEGKSPTPGDVNAYANNMGIDPNMLSMLMFANMGAGAGMDMDLSGMLPVPQIVGGYNPKLRNMPYMIMGQIERRLGAPVVVINADGSVNPDLTVKYIMSLEEGFDAATDNVFYDEGGAPYEIIGVGVDAQGIYDADPVNPTRALQKNGMGVGRINWHSVPLDVRQVVFYATTQTHELNSSDDAGLARLRDKIGPTTTRLNLRGDFPKAMAAYNEALRTGSLPTLRVQLSRSPRRREVMPRRQVRGDNQRRRIEGDPGDPDQ